MSWQASTWVAERSESRLGSRLVMMVIAHHYSNDDGQAHPSLKTIAREARISKQHVITAVRNLVKSGELMIRKGGGAGNVNVYHLPLFHEWFATFCLERVKSSNPFSEVKGQIHSSKRVKSEGEKGSNLSPYIKNKKRREKEFRAVEPTAHKRTGFPEGFALTFEMKQFAESKSVQQPLEEFEAFRDYHSARGSLFRDWPAAWRTWCRNSQKFGGRNGSSANKAEGAGARRTVNAVHSGRPIDTSHVHRIDNS